MQVQRFGWIHDIPDQRDIMYAPPPAVEARLPASVDLTSGFPDPYDQGQLGSCTANSIAGALQFLEKKEGAASPVMPSRLFIYYNERAIEGTVASDAGAQIRDGIKTVVKQGYCPESKWPYDITKFAQKPPAQCYTDALKDKVTSYLRLAQVESVLLTCLASGFPFVFGFSVYESFESPQVAQTGVADLPAPAERLIGGHAVVAEGYDQVSRRFRVRNSWGPGWGQHGSFTIPFEYLTNPTLASDFWTIRQVPVS